jgi:hypothetical protein
LVYKWSTYNFKVDAQKVGETLEALEAKNGNFSAQDMVDEARKKRSVLHPLFEWDDAKAAEAYRVTQANNILHCLVVQDDKVEEPVRAFVNVSINGVARKGTFMNIQSAMSDSLSKEIVLKNAIMELAAFKRKYEKLEELQEVFKAINNVERRNKK